LQGIVISNVYRGKDAPDFKLGLIVTICYLAICLFGGSVLHYALLWRENKLRTAGARDYRVEGKDSREIDRLGDLRYVFVNR